MNRVIVTSVFLLAMLTPALAVACPQCAGQGDGGVLGAVILGTMILSPFIVAILVFPILRKLAAPLNGSGLDERRQQEEIG